jgi:hypothetical protein
VRGWAISDSPPLAILSSLVSCVLPRQHISLGFFIVQFHLCPFHNPLLDLISFGYFSFVTMEQTSEPNAAAIYDARRRRGSVGTTQLFENIVSTSNCEFATVAYGSFLVERS